MFELSFHCLARSCHLEVLMVISIDTLLIKQLRKLLNVILVISNSWWQDVWRDNSILENMSSWHLYRCVFWPISQQCQFFLVCYLLLLDFYILWCSILCRFLFICGHCVVCFVQLSSFFGLLLFVMPGLSQNGMKQHKLDIWSEVLQADTSMLNYFSNLYVLSPRRRYSPVPKSAVTAWYAQVSLIQPWFYGVYERA